MTDDLAGLAGQTLQHFKMVRDLGDGPWGRAWLAEDTRQPRKVAVRFLPVAAAADAEYMRRLRREAGEAGRLNDMQLLRAVAIGEHAGRCYLAVEHVEGETLDRRVAREGALQPEEAVAIAIQIARGLRYAHAHGCLHGNLRPSNVVMSGGLARLIDTGLTPPPGAPEPEDAPFCRAPERSVPGSPPDVGWDLYALGATCYRIVTGLVLKGTPPDPRDLCPGLPDGVAHVIRRLMAKRRNDRYVHAEAALTDLERVIDGQEPAVPAIVPALTVVAPAKPAKTPSRPAPPVVRPPECRPAPPTAAPPSRTSGPVWLASALESVPDEEETRLDRRPVTAPVPGARPVPPASASSSPPPPSPAAPQSPPAAVPKQPAREARAAGARPAPPVPVEQDGPDAVEAFLVKSIQKAAAPVRRATPGAVIGARRAAAASLRYAKSHPKPAGAVAAGLILLILIVFLLSGRDSGTSGGASKPPRRAETAAVPPPAPPGTKPPVTPALPVAPVTPAPPTRETGSAETPKPIPEMPAPPPSPPPDFAALSGEAWTRAVRDLPPEDQVRQVVARLQQLNPAFDGREAHLVADGQVQAISFPGQGLKDLSPLASLPALRRLDGRFIVAPDLAALAGGRLAEVTCAVRSAQDVESLRALLSLERINGMTAAAFRASSEEAGALARAGGGAEPDDPAWAKAVDLLALVEPSKDGIRGTWTVQGGELLSDGSAGARLVLPYLPPEEYDLRVRFTRREGHGGVTQVLTRAGRSFAWRMGAESNTVFGLDLGRAGGAGEGPPETRMAWCLENGRPYTALVQVRKDGVQATVNGKAFPRWAAEIRGGGPDAAWALDRADVPGLGSQESPTVFHRALLRGVSGTGRLLRPPPAVAGDGTGLKGAYYVGRGMDVEPAFARIDPTVDFDWDVGSPDARIPVDSFSVRWTGQVQPQHTEETTFHVIADDGARLWVDGKPVIDDWRPAGRAFERSGSVMLKAGVKVDIKLEYVEYRSEASVRLLWSGFSTPKAVIPKSQLYPGS